MSPDERANSNGETHFGFRTVAEKDKAGLVHGVFSRVASRYDVMNDLMSVGVHRVWKTAMMDWLAPREGQHLLDVAGGTGDIAFRFLERAPGARVTVCDMTESMLVEGRKRAEAGRLADRLAWVTGDAMRLPFADDSFDRYTISFGIRNVTSIPDALAEARRVLRPGGRLMLCSLARHEHKAAVEAYGHVNLGFTGKELRKFVEKAGLDVSSLETVTREKRPPHFEVISLIAHRP